MDAHVGQFGQTLRVRGARLLVQIRDAYQKLWDHEYTPRGLALLFLLAAFIGFGLKSVVHETWTIGFDDYRVKKNSTAVDLNLLQKDIIEKGGSFATGSRTVPRGPSCTEEQK